jgi:4-hydroxy-tetrahydrodipicolinate reductase
MTRIAVIGAAGRMGRTLLRLVLSDPDITLSAAIVSARSGCAGEDAAELVGLPPSGVRLSSQLRPALAAADVALDFSSAASAETNLLECVAAGKPLLLGTTGFAHTLESHFSAAGSRIPLLVAPNTSVGITMLLELVRTAAAALPADFDIEIFEAHHRAKRDAPSGTALALGAAAAEARGLELQAARVAHTETSGAPRRGQIGFASVRAGDIVGEHQVWFAGEGERLSLSHQATERAVFARGALKAAVWLAAQAPGRYFMRDFVLAKSSG